MAACRSWPNSGACRRRQSTADATSPSTRLRDCRRPRRRDRTREENNQILVLHEACRPKLPAVPALNSQQFRQFPARSATELPGSAPQPVGAGSSPVGSVGSEIGHRVADFRRAAKVSLETVALGNHNSLSWGLRRGSQPTFQLGKCDCEVGWPEGSRRFGFR
jgi:hypothetical protein